MAAAHVSGVAAILLQGQSWVTGASVRRTLQLAAIPAVVGHMQASAGVGYTGAAFTDRFLNVLRLPQRAFVVSVAFPDGDIESSEVTLPLLPRMGAWMRLSPVPDCALTVTRSAPAGPHLLDPPGVAQVEVTAPGQYTFRVRMPVAPSAPVTVSLTLAAADSAGMSLSRSSLAFMETDWETPQDVVLTVEGELAGPSALAFVDLEAQSDDAGLDGAVLAVAIRDARIPLGDTPEEPLVVGPGAMNADGTVTVDMGPWEWTRSPLMDDRSLFTCKGVSQGTTGEQGKSHDAQQLTRAAYLSGAGAAVQLCPEACE